MLPEVWQGFRHTLSQAACDCSVYLQMACKTGSEGLIKEMLSEKYEFTHSLLENEVSFLLSTDNVCYIFACVVKFLL